MTKSGDKIAVEAAKAATLVKATAESTATALNIQYIQKDILEIKEGIKGLTAMQNDKIDLLEAKYEALSKLVYIGVGASSVLSILLRFWVK